MNPLERCKIHPTKDRYATFELAEEAASKKEETYKTPHRSYLCDKLGPNGEEPCGGYHHTSDKLPPVAEVSSVKYTKTDWSKFAPAIILPSTRAKDTHGRGRPSGSGGTQAMVNERRERVRKAVFGNSHANYKDIAESLGMSHNTFMSDVQALQRNNILPYRNESGSRVQPLAAPPRAPALPAMTAAQKLAMLKKQIMEVEQEVAKDEAARIERERVHVEWIVGENLETLIQVRKNTAKVSYPIDVWRELIPAVSAEIDKRDNNEIDFPLLKHPVVGTIVSGPNAGQIHPDYRRHDV